MAVVLSAFAVVPVAAAAAGPSRVRSHPSQRGASVAAVRAKGGTLYDHPRPKITDHDQGGPLKLPEGPSRFRPRQLQTSITSAVRPAIHADTPSISVSVNTANAVPTSLVPAEPDEASDGNIVVYTTNDYVGFSVNGGATFASFTPASLYKDSPDGGADGDQVVQFAPQINRFIWIDQYFAGTNGANRYRLAVFPPSAVTAHGLSSWTHWDITAASMPGLTRPFLDFPDLALGSKYLYLSCNNAQNGKIYSSVIARIGLQNLADGANLAAAPEPWRYVTGSLFFGRVAQNTGSVAYWAQNTSTSQLQVSDWPESSTSWSGPQTVNVDSWPNTNYTTTTPDGDNWLSTYTGTILASAVTPPPSTGGAGNLWLAWTAGIGSGRLSWLTQPHIELADLSLPGFAFKSQRAIWNPDYAIAYPNLNVSQAGHLGIAMAYGGSGLWVNSAVGDLTVSPNLGWSLTTSSATCGCNRWGDYIAIRPAYGQKGSTFTASGYGADKAGAGYSYDPHFAAFTVNP